MNIKQAKNEIKNTVTAYLKKNEYGEYLIPAIRQRPLLLIGPPGIGKTQIMSQIAQECEIGLVAYTITHHTRQSAVGLPFIKEENFDGKSVSTTEYTMSEIIASIYHKQEETGLKEGILFIDEINCVSETLAPTMLQFLQCKTFGNQKIPEGWIIVAAGNPAEYNKSVREFDMVTLDRVRYMDVKADYEVWKEYALERRIHRSILSYLDLKPNRFYRVEADVDGMHFVTARGWEDLSNLIWAYESLNISLQEEIVKEYIHHEDIAEDFYAYFELYKKYEDDYGITDILNGRIATSVYTRLYSASFDERISFVNLLLEGLSVLFDQYKNQLTLVDQWYLLLKQYRKDITDENYKLLYQDVIARFEEDVNRKKKEGILTTDQIHLQDRLLKCMKDVDIKEGLNAKEAFSVAMEPFQKQKETLDIYEQKVYHSLNHCFECAGNAFDSGQEMVVFVTALAVDSNSASFLAQHEVELYEKYKEQLLIGTRRAKLMDDLQH